MQDYQKLIVWQKSHEMTLLVYKLTKNFPKEETFGIASQLRRAASSIPANLAEGCGRLHQNDMSRFFQIALGSANEVSYFILLSFELGYLNKSDYDFLSGISAEIKAMLIALVKKSRVTS